jgi:hypothetical protein
MDRSELVVHILEIRNARRYVPKPKAEPKPRRGKVVERKPKDFINMLTAEQAAALYSQLMNGDNEEESEDEE